MTTTVQLDGLKLIAQGGQADIYDFGDGKVLRVGRRPQDLERIRYEYAVYSSLNEADVHIPKVYGLVEAAGMPAIIMERLNGSVNDGSDQSKSAICTGKGPTACRYSSGDWKNKGSRADYRGEVQSQVLHHELGVHFRGRKTRDIGCVAGSARRDQSLPWRFSSGKSNGSGRQELRN